MAHIVTEQSITVRGVPIEVVKLIKQAAICHRCSMEQEIRELLVSQYYRSRKAMRTINRASAWAQKYGDKKGVSPKALKDMINEGRP